MKAARNSPRSKASSVVPVIMSRAVRRVKSYRGPEAFGLVTGEEILNQTRWPSVVSRQF